MHEFRLDERRARRLLPRDVGTVLGGSVRKIVVRSDDPLVERICELDRLHYPLISSWNVTRRYGKRELEAAELFDLVITAFFEPEGESCGTVYDYSQACPHCGAGRRQVSELVLDLRRVPRRADIACSIARDEWIVSQRLASLLRRERISGLELRPVRHRSHFEDEGYELASVPSGRELLRRAEAIGLRPASWEFDVWLNEPEQDELALRSREENVARLQAKERRRPPRHPLWYQLVVTSAGIPVAVTTRFGEDLCRDEDRYRCPLGHSLGLNILSELHLERTGWDGSDIACTRELVGYHMGVLMPAPLIVISPRLRAVFEEAKIRGYRVEVAHLQ